VLWWMAPLRRTTVNGTIGWRAVRRRPCTRLGFAGLRLRSHWLWPCGPCVCRRGVCWFGTCGRLFRMCYLLLGTRDVAFAWPCLRPRGWLWGPRSVAFGWSCFWLCLRPRGWLRRTRSVAFGWSCFWLCRAFGWLFRLRLCAFGRLGLPVVLRFRTILCMQRVRQRRGETTEEKPVKHPGRRPCFYCHDSLSVWKNVQPMRGEGKPRHQICLAWMHDLGGRRLGFVQRG
jgi:hypothetical protein